MALLSDIRMFLGGKIKNPIMVGAIAYLIYRLLGKYIKKESINNASFIENIRIIKKNNNEEVIYDTSTKMYIHINNNEIIGTSKNEIKI